MKFVESLTRHKETSVNLSRKIKREYFANITINNIADNKKFWRTVKPLLSDKISH